MQHHIITVGAFEVNCVILWEQGPPAWVVDPGGNAPEILDFLRRRGLQVAQIVLTHGHIDHIAALDEMLAEQPAPVLMHPADAAWAFTPLNRLPPYEKVPARPATLLDIKDDAEIAAAGLTARALHTPGHSPGGVCLHFEREGLLLSGDTLFAGSVGRTDLPGGDGRLLTRSLRRLAALPATTTVIPGHGPSTSIEDECCHNPFLMAEGLRAAGGRPNRWSVDAPA
jgi:glyoxylase-like metal-dependent hydrolase (beta-lactamase superfamily II)